MTKTLHAQIPATSANVGSGFDAVGIALTLYNDIYFTEEPDKDTITVEIEGLGANSLPRNFDENMVGQAMKAVAIKNRQSLPKGGTLRLVNVIPPARGLGSSSAALVGGILIGNALTGNKMTREDMLTMATVLEGHPDNVAPAIYGGLSVSIMVDGKTLTNSIPIDDDLSFITVSPEVEVSTEEARKALPKTRAPSSTSAASASSFLRCSPSSTTASPMACRINCTCPTACASSPAANWSSRRPSKPVPWALPSAVPVRRSSPLRRIRKCRSWTP